MYQMLQFRAIIFLRVYVTVLYIVCCFYQWILDEIDSSYNGGTSYNGFSKHVSSKLAWYYVYTTYDNISVGMW